MAKGPLSEKTLNDQLKLVQDFSKSLSALTTAFKALTEETDDYSVINQKLGKRLEDASDKFIKITKKADDYAQRTINAKEKSEDQVKAAKKLETALGTLGSKYTTLANKELKEFNKAQQKYIDISNDEAAAIKKANQVEQEILKTKREAFRVALAEAKLRIQLDRERKESLQKEVNDLNKAEKAKSKIRKSGLDAVNKRIKEEKASNERLVAAQEKLYARLERANNKRIEKERIAAEKLAESRKFFGKSFFAAFSPESIGKAIASVVKFISIYEILGRVVGSVSNFFRGSIEQFIDFDKNISRVSAVTGASGANLKLLSDEIRSVAVETRFTATEISELAIELGKLGLSAVEIPKLINPIAIAAQATGESLTGVGSALVKVGNQFNLSTAEAATTSAILTQAVNKSALTLEDFGTAIGYVGPLAAQSGLDFDKTATILGVLSDNGFSASRAGTGLRGILLKLKKPGEDITETLNNLAASNISVSKAEELVGRTSAAQLITILQNIDAINQNSIAQEGFAEQLRSTGAQMSSFSGQLDILKSAYSELQISVGSFLVQNELVLQLIGVLSSKSEELARGFVIVKTESERLGDAFQKRLSEGLKNGNSELEILNSLLKDSDDENIKEVLKTLNSANPKSLEELNRELDKIEKGPAWAQNAIIGIGLISETAANSVRGFLDLFMSIDETAQGVKGLTNQITLLSNEQKNTINLEFGVRAVNKQYEGQVSAIEKLTDATKQRNDAVNLSQQLQKRANAAEKQSNELLQSADSKERARGNQLAGRAKAYRVLITRLSEYTNELKKNQEADKDPTDKFKNEFNLRLKSFEIERKGIEDSQKDSKKAFDFRMKQIEDEFKIKEGKATTEAELLDVLAKKREEEKKVIDSYSEELAIYADKTADLTSRSAAFFDEFTAKFKGSEENTQNLINKLDQWADSISNLAQANSELGLDAQLTIVKEAAQLYEDGAAAIDLFSSRLKELESQYEKTEYGQINLSIAQKKYIEEATKELAERLDKYNKMFAALSSQVGEDVAKQVLQPFSDVTETLIKELNKAIKEGTLNDETIQEIKKKLVFLKGTIEDGIGKDDVILKIDITPAEVIKAALDETLDAITSFNDVAFENTKNRLDKELQEVRSRAEIEDDILQAKLEGQLISEAEYRAQVEKNRKKEIQAQNRIDKQIFDAEQKRDKQQALVDYLSALGSIIPTLIKRGEAATPLDISLKAAITAGFATAGYGLELSAINQRRFYPTKFAEGGIVNGPSHSEGGVPFTVRGQGGYEMEGGEYIVNKKSTQKYKSLLDQINGYGKSNYKFAAGGVVKNPTEVANRQIELLEAIASSNISMVGKLDKPVRAFVASNDLRSDENARRIQERNSQL